MNRLADAARPVAPIWLPPLPAAVTLDQAAGGLAFGPDGVRLACGRSGGLAAPLGVLDDPVRQWQGPWLVDLHAGGGHLLIMGGPASGTSTALRTLAFGPRDDAQPHHGRHLRHRPARQRPARPRRAAARRRRGRAGRTRARAPHGGRGGRDAGCAGARVRPPRPGHGRRPARRAGGRAAARSWAATRWCSSWTATGGSGWSSRTWSPPCTTWWPAARGTACTSSRRPGGGARCGRRSRWRSRTGSSCA